MRNFMPIATVIASIVAVALAVWAASDPHVPGASQHAAESSVDRGSLPARPRDNPAAAAATAEARREARAARRAEQREDMKQQRAEARVKLEAEREQSRLPPDERAQARREQRSAQLDELLLLNDGYGEENGWSDDQIDEVASLLISGADEISILLERVDLGEASWEELRPEMRAMRREHAQEVERVLGPEGFRAWSESMGFERFSGEDGARVRQPDGQTP